ncbi:MAG: hypothetical protein JWP34_564 [Massilia sp.]|nr:hypothetical protein [Massilia sp.]
MVRLSYFLCGVNDAGTTFVIRRVDAPRATRFLPIWCPEWFLSEWEREGPNAGSTYIGEVLMRMLAVEHKATFKALELTPPQPRFEPEHNKVEALSPFDHKGAMRPQRIALAMGHNDTTLRVVPFEGDKMAARPKAGACSAISCWGRWPRCAPTPSRRTPTWSRRWGSSHPQADNAALPVHFRLMGDPGVLATF